MAETTLRQFRGDRLPWEFTLKRGGVVIDLTGATVTFTVRKGDHTGDKAYDYTKTQGGTGSAAIDFPSPGFTLGRVNVTPVLAESQALLTAQLYVWDLQVVLTSGLVLTYPRDAAGNPVLGELKVVPDAS